MPKITAFIISGNIEPADGFVPTHWAYLVESMYPVWYISPAGLFTTGPDFRSTWITSPETVVDDAVAMVATVVERLHSLADIIGSVRNHVDGESVDLSQLAEETREKLTRLNQMAKHSAHLLLIVLAGSLVSEQMGRFSQYPISVEICTSRYIQAASFANCKRRAPDATGAPPNPFEVN